VWSIRDLLEAASLLSSTGLESKSRDQEGPVNGPHTAVTKDITIRFLAKRTSSFMYPTKGRRPSLPLDPPSGYSIRWVLEERLGDSTYNISSLGVLG
jgi:hypothetical protein